MQLHRLDFYYTFSVKHPRIKLELSVVWVHNWNINVRFVVITKISPYLIKTWRWRTYNEYILALFTRTLYRVFSQAVFLSHSFSYCQSCTETFSWFRIYETLLWPAIQIVEITIRLKNNISEPSNNGNEVRYYFSIVLTQVLKRVKKKKQNEKNNLKLHECWWMFIQH